VWRLRKRIGTVDSDADFTRLKAELDLSIRHFHRSVHTYGTPFRPLLVVRRCFLEKLRVWRLWRHLHCGSDLPTVQTSSKLRFHRGSMDPILRLRIPVLTVSRVNGSDFTHLGTSFHRKLFNCLLTTVKTGTQMCKI
jgi:hypothetical protein